MVFHLIEQEKSIFRMKVNLMERKLNKMLNMILHKVVKTQTWIK